MNAVFSQCSLGSRPSVCAYEQQRVRTVKGISRVATLLVDL